MKKQKFKKLCSKEDFKIVHSELTENPDYIELVAEVENNAKMNNYHIGQIFQLKHDYPESIEILTTLHSKVVALQNEYKEK